jgi:hypothetical protein
MLFKKKIFLSTLKQRLKYKKGFRNYQGHCHLCSKKYYSLFPYRENQSFQAWGCASSTCPSKDDTQLYIYSGYGSNYDWQRIIVNQEKISLKTDMDICDKCINEGIEKGFFSIDENFSPYQEYIDYMKEHEVFKLDDETYEKLQKGEITWDSLFVELDEKGNPIQNVNK